MVDSECKRPDLTAIVSRCVTRHAKRAQVLFEINPDFEVTTNMLDLAETFEELCGTGRLRVCQWYVRVFSEVLPHVDFKRALGQACAEGSMPVARWLVTTWPHIYSQLGYEEGFISACISGNLPLTQWLWSLCTRNLEWQGSSACSDTVQMAFESACACDLLKVAQWIADTYSNIDPGEALMGTENFEVFQWLLDRFFTDQIHQLDVAQVFTIRCYNGNTKAAKLLLTKFPERVGDPHKGFVLACGNGYLGTARWMFETFEHLQPQLAFKSACEGGQLETAKWLSGTWPEVNPMPDPTQDPVFPQNDAVQAWLEERWPHMTEVYHRLDRDYFH